MPARLAHDHPTIIIRRSAWERSGIPRAAIDERLGLTDDEFRVDGNLILVGPVPDPGPLTDFIAELETAGLEYFEDFFEVSGNLPPWLALYAVGAEAPGTQELPTG